MTAVTELTGRVPAEAVHASRPQIPAEIVERYFKIGDMSATVADALDDLGLIGTVAASALRPTILGARVVGTAVTVRNIPRQTNPYLNLKEPSRLAEIEGHNQARPGDVLVVQGVPNVSNMGGMSATEGQRQGEVGAIVDGGIRDVPWQRQINFPVWSLHITPTTGKWRVETVEVNGPVVIQGVTVYPGDLVIADDTGVCFVPAFAVERVLERCEAIAAGEAVRHEDIANGVPLHVLARKPRPYLEALHVPTEHPSDAR